jgi:pyruvate,orthophosphate dikinase
MRVSTDGEGDGGPETRLHMAVGSSTTTVSAPEAGERAATRYVYDFAEGSRDMRDLLGGKGANICEMTRLLGADLVPAGFVITSEACVVHMTTGAEPPELDEQIAEAMERLQAHVGRRFGDESDPLLLSVRSGSRESMPGMMDTVLDLGLNDRSVEGLARATRNERFAWDSYRRFLQMFANVVRGVPGEELEAEIAQVKERHGVRLDTELDVDALHELAAGFKRIFREHTGEDFPQDPAEQLRQAILAVFDSWSGDRAVAYRRINHIPDSWGTAANVQQMVYGNKGETSASGVAFSRDELTGGPEPSGDFLLNAQGEDVVSGVRNAQELSELATVMPQVHAHLIEILRTLERHYGDIQDTEFTVEEGRLYMLQTRNAKRPAQAAVRFAVDAVAEELLTKAAAIMTIDASSLDALLHPTFDPSTPYRVLARGLSGRSQGRDRVHRARGRRRRCRGHPRGARAALHGGRRRRRLLRRPGHPHQRGRQGLARRPGRARHGPPVRVRGERARHRPRGRDRPRRRRGPPRGRHDRDQRQHR